ncbi:MAG: hypothetical protein HW378_3565 [Anaerolineales bacterium]|nr:hypothetical protein [Anaerolineales bacterium]
MRMAASALILVRRTAWLMRSAAIKPHIQASRVLMSTPYCPMEGATLEREGCILAFGIAAILSAKCGGCN